MAFLRTLRSGPHDVKDSVADKGALWKRDAVVAFQLLRRQIRVLLEYVRGAQNGTLVPDYQLILRIQALVNQLPLLDPASSSRSQAAVASSALALLTKAWDLVNNVLRMASKASRQKLLG